MMDEWSELKIKELQGMITSLMTRIRTIEKKVGIVRSCLFCGLELKDESDCCDSCKKRLQEAERRIHRAKHNHQENVHERYREQDSSIRKECAVANKKS